MPTEPATPPAEHHPIEEAAPQAEAAPESTPPAPAPTLAGSDALMTDSLSGLIGKARFDALFIADELIRRIVVTVDNLPRQKLAYRQLPVHSAPGQFRVAGTPQAPVIADDNAARYAAYVQLAEAIDARALVGLYVRYYPLFQQAYQDLGYPNGYFNDRLIVAIDNLLATPEVTGPIALSHPSVWYEYADPQLEQCSSGQKILLRIGADNAAKIKAKLREIRAQLVARAPHQTSP